MVRPGEDDWMPSPAKCAERPISGLDGGDVALSRKSTFASARAALLSLLMRRQTDHGSTRRNEALAIMHERS